MQNLYVSYWEREDTEVVCEPSERRHGMKSICKPLIRVPALRLFANRGAWRGDCLCAAGRGRVCCIKPLEGMRALQLHGC